MPRAACSSVPAKAKKPPEMYELPPETGCSTTQTRAPACAAVAGGHQSGDARTGHQDVDILQVRLQFQ